VGKKGEESKEVNGGGTKKIAKKRKGTGRKTTKKRRVALP